MRLPGDAACYVELEEVALLPVAGSSSLEPYVRQAKGTVSCAYGSHGPVWTATFAEGEWIRFLLPGARVTVSGVNRRTGERYTLPVELICVRAGRAVRLSSELEVARVPRWAMAG